MVDGVAKIESVEGTTTLVPVWRLELGFFEGLDEFLGKAKGNGEGQDFFEEVMLFVDLLTPCSQLDPFFEANYFLKRLSTFGSAGGHKEREGGNDQARGNNTNEGTGGASDRGEPRPNQSYTSNGDDDAGNKVNPADGLRIASKISSVSEFLIEAGLGLLEMFIGSGGKLGKFY